MGIFHVLDDRLHRPFQRPPCCQLCLLLSRYFHDGAGGKSRCIGEIALSGPAPFPHAPGSFSVDPQTHRLCKQAVFFFSRFPRSQAGFMMDQTKNGSSSTIASGKDRSARPGRSHGLSWLAPALLWWAAPDRAIRYPAHRACENIDAALSGDKVRHSRCAASR